MTVIIGSENLSHDVANQGWLEIRAGLQPWWTDCYGEANLRWKCVSTSDIPEKN